MRRLAGEQRVDEAAGVGVAVLPEAELGFDDRQIRPALRQRRQQRVSVIIEADADQLRQALGRRGGAGEAGGGPLRLERLPGRRRVVDELGAERAKARGCRGYAGARQERDGEKAKGTRNQKNTGSR